MISTGDLQRLTLYTISDGSGDTAEHVAKAAAVHFRGQAIKIVRLPRIRGIDQLLGLLDLAASQGPAVIAYTMVERTMKAILHTEAERRGIPAVDLLGSLIDALAVQLGVEPRLEPGLIQVRDEAYFGRMDAIDFAIKYDDGKDPKGLILADLVLLGVSRTSKTPTCMYLAQNRGLKVSNVPLVLNVAPPEELFGLPPGKVIGLTLNPALLHEIRTARLATLGLGPGANYADPDRITQELAYAHGIYKRLGCPTVDVTHKAIEETANEILELTHRKETFV